MSGRKTSAQGAVELRNDVPGFGDFVFNGLHQALELRRQVLQFRQPVCQRVIHDPQFITTMISERSVLICDCGEAVELYRNKLDPSRIDSRDWKIASIFQAHHLGNVRRHTNMRPPDFVAYCSADLETQLRGSERCDVFVISPLPERQLRNSVTFGLVTGLNLETVPGNPGGDQRACGGQDAAPCALIPVDPKFAARSATRRNQRLPSRLIAGLCHPRQRVDNCCQEQRYRVGDQFGSGRRLHRATLPWRRLARKLVTPRLHSFARAA